MSSSRWKSFALAALLAASPSAFAFTPESGFWWNPDEPGTGYNIEIQDNWLGITAYVFRPEGTSAWFISAGPMTGNSGYSSTLDGFSGGQCIGCPYPGYPAVQQGAGGPISIDFLTEITATITIGNRTTSIERQNFRLGDDTERMQGEWQVVLDVYDFGTAARRQYPYLGDVLSIDSVDFSGTTDFFDGCRPTNTEIARCTNDALRDHPLSGFYKSSTGEHVIVVTDVPESEPGPETFFAYYVEAGLTQFDGVVEIYNEGQSSGNGPFYPVRGFRSASRNFVVTGTGPSSVNLKQSATPNAGLSTLLRDANGALPTGMTADQVKAKYGFDPRDSTTGVTAVTARLKQQAKTLAD